MKAGRSNTDQLYHSEHKLVKLITVGKHSAETLETTKQMCLFLSRLNEVPICVNYDFIIPPHVGEVSVNFCV
jgi:hypothetical protein